MLGGPVSVERWIDGSRHLVDIEDPQEGILDTLRLRAGILHNVGIAYLEGPKPGSVLHQVVHFPEIVLVELHHPLVGGLQRVRLRKIKHTWERLRR